jgi:two-component sensor histidine kinase
VMSIASVHRSLYLSSEEGRVNADSLLKFVIDTTIEAGAVATDGIEITKNYEPVVVYPDQAVPLSLFAAEAVTNALKYIGRRADGVACLDITLTAQRGEHASLSVSNSQGTPLIPPDLVKGSGLGHTLLTAFAVQMRGEFEFEQTDTSYMVRVSFPVLPFTDEVADGAIHASD